MKIIILFFTELQVSILQSVYLKTLDKTFLFSIKKTTYILGVFCIMVVFTTYHL